MAAGVTLTADRLGDWRAFLEEKLAEPVAKARAEASLAVDAAHERRRRHARNSPSGWRPPAPTAPAIRSRSSPCRAIASPMSPPSASIICGCGRWPATARRSKAIAFRSVGKTLGAALIRLRGAPVHLAGTLSVNRYKGRERAQIRVVDVAEAAG